MTTVAILWHMHQPFYEDLASREHILPWVRLHALKDYYGMVAMLREFPDVKMTFNLVPSLLVQIEAFAAGEAQDRCLELGLKSADELNAADVDFILENFFHAQQQRMIDVHPRYAELMTRRGRSMPPGGERRAVARRFSVDDLRDLQVWHKLAWIDPSYLDSDERVRALVKKGSRFNEDDKAVLRAVELELLNRVIPEYRSAAARGQIEISTSPFYHPILPLLCDSDVYLRTHPGSPMPRQRFLHPDDAALQLERAAACHLRLFGRRPTGLWPSEGSVSDAVVSLAAAAGFSWMATDELILARTLDTTFSRDSQGRIEQPEFLYRPYTVSAGGASLACAFRDHSLSDLIGFSYAGWPAEVAADDFVQHLVNAGERYAQRTGGEEALITIILDGENAWEHFEGGGRPFLRALYRRLSSRTDLRTVTLGEACSTTDRLLPGIFPGSWIDANFYIWIGHPDDQRAWNQLADARRALDAAQELDPASIERAREEVLIAEGSDWFWWYGDDHSSAHDLEFDDLFRRHLQNVYRVLRKPVPDELFVSNISAERRAVETTPTALLTPTLDGEATSYFEWLGAGTMEVRKVAGTMHRSDSPESILTLVQFGFDRDYLYVRLDGARPMVQILGEGLRVSLKFRAPAGFRLSVRGKVGDPIGVPGARAAAGTILELRLPLAALGLQPGDAVAFVVMLTDAEGTELETHPGHRPIEVTVPDALFEARNWSA
jgi:alpha-amylase/alpha-mannosidase (GH57 family)